METILRDDEFSVFDQRKIREDFFHAKIPCFTVPVFGNT